MKGKHVIKLLITTLLLSLTAGCLFLPIKIADVTGVVEYSDGSAVAGADIRIAGRTARTGADGSFEIHNVPHGKHKLEVLVNGVVVQTVDVTVKDNLTPLSIVIEVVETGEIQGVVIDDTNNQPIEGAVVKLGAREVVTNAQGAFSFTDVAYGTHTLTIDVNGDLYEEEVDLNSAVVEVTIRITPKSLLVTSFEDDSDLENWDVLAVDLSIDNSRSTHGSASLRAVYTTDHGWPKIVLYMDQDGTDPTRPTDWTGFSAIAVDVWNDDSEARQLSFKIITSGGSYDRLNILLEPGQWTEFRISMEVLEAEAEVNLSSVQSIEYWMSNQGSDIPIFFDRLRFIY